MKLLGRDSNYVGIASASLCVAHCLLTPILIVLVAKFEWWHTLSYLFLIISLWALYEAIKSKPPKLILFVLSGSFLTLLFSITFEDSWAYAEAVSYVASMGLVLGHLFNLRYCKKC